MPVDSEYQKFAASMLKHNPKMKVWEIRDKWLDRKYAPEQNDEQMVTGDQTTRGLMPTKTYREDEETPETQQINKNIQQLTQNPKIAPLGLKLDCVGQKGADGKDSRVWYLFSNKTETTPTGPQAKKWGGYSTAELSQMSAELENIGDKGLDTHFNAPVGAPKPKTNTPTTQPTSR